jgi:hypothetical protein
MYEIIEMEPLKKPLVNETRETMKDYVGFTFVSGSHSFEVIGVSKAPLKEVGPDWYRFTEYFLKQYNFELKLLHLPVFLCKRDSSRDDLLEFNDHDLQMFLFCGGIILPPEICAI